MKRALHVLRKVGEGARRVTRAVHACTGCARLAQGVHARIRDLCARRREAWAVVSAKLLPGACALCGALCDAALCDGCAACLADTQARCARCGVPMPMPVPQAESDAGNAPARGPTPSYDTPCDPNDGAICGRCIAREPAFDATVCVADYAEPADALAIALKFHTQLALAGVFGAALAARTLATTAALPDLIVPVPLSSVRLTQRGYNQAWEIARVFSRAIQRPATARSLARTRDTRAQSGLRGVERWRNMRRAFVVTRPEPIRGAHIGLVDDVMTSGATLDAAARALKRAGAARVTVFVVLRTPTS